MELPFHERTVLQRAIESGDVKKCSLFMKLGCNPNAKYGPQQLTPMMICCYSSERHAVNKRLEIMKLLLENGSDPAIRDINGNNVLHHACSLGLINVVTLVSQSMDSSLYAVHNNKERDTPLHICAGNGAAEILEIILDKASKHGHDINTLNKSGQTPLAIAYAMNQPKCIEILYDYGAVPGYRSTVGPQATYDEGNLTTANSPQRLSLTTSESEMIFKESLVVSLEYGDLSSTSITAPKQEMFVCSSSDIKVTSTTSTDMIKLFMGSSLYHHGNKGTRDAVGMGKKHQEPMTQKWLNDIHEYKPGNTFANIASLIVRSRSGTRRKTVSPADRSRQSARASRASSIIQSANVNKQ